MVRRETYHFGHVVDKEWMWWTWLNKMIISMVTNHKKGEAWQKFNASKHSTVSVESWKAKKKLAVDAQSKKAYDAKKYKEDVQ
jgi:peptidylprolyl isomerase